MGCLDAFRRRRRLTNCSAVPAYWARTRLPPAAAGDELAGTQIERGGRAALRFERLLYNLASSLLGEVERSYGDGPVVRRMLTDAPFRIRTLSHVIAITATTITTTRRLPAGASPRSNARSDSPTQGARRKERTAQPDGATNEDGDGSSRTARSASGVPSDHRAPADDVGRRRTRRRPSRNTGATTARAGSR
jgi:hypothetical protein